jgi:preprotein translocase subunit SecB
MADDQAASQNGAGASGQAAPQIRVLAQYVKDFSLENPNIEAMLAGPAEAPRLQVEVNVAARPIVAQPNHYESAIELHAKAANSKHTIYEMELLYGGVFRIENLPPQALEPFLLINCPMLLFPFVRRIAADMTREAGYPPLFLDPIDFAALYVERQRRAQQGSGETSTA